MTGTHFPMRPGIYCSLASWTDMWSWTLVGAMFVAAVVPVAGSNPDPSLDLSKCTMAIQKQCRGVNEKFVEANYNFDQKGKDRDRERNRGLMCGQLIELLKCVSRKAITCNDWFLSVHQYFFQSPYDCNITAEHIRELQKIKNKQNKVPKDGDRSSGSDGGGGAAENGTKSVQITYEVNTSSSNNNNRSGKTTVTSSRTSSVGGKRGDQAKHEGQNSSDPNNSSSYPLVNIWLLIMTMLWSASASISKPSVSS